MKDLYIRIGCFLTGYNYNILKHCSELSRKSVKKYTSALLILVIIWAITGYLFADRYVFRNQAKPKQEQAMAMSQAEIKTSGLNDLIKAKDSVASIHTQAITKLQESSASSSSSSFPWGSILVSLFFVIIVIQIERQIILDVGKHKAMRGFRFVIAIIMAILGSTILDQIIFKDDIDRKKIEVNSQEVNRLLPARIALINTDLDSLSKEILKLEKEKEKLNEEITRAPMVSGISSQTKLDKINIDGKDTLIHITTVEKKMVPNSKIEQIPPINERIEKLIEKRTLLEDKRLHTRDELKEEIESKAGFLDELKVMVIILRESTIALTFYLLLFLFLLSLELFVVSSKAFDEENDYILVVQHQFYNKKKALEEFLKKEDQLSSTLEK